MQTSQTASRSGRQRLLDRPWFNKLLITSAAATWGLSFVFMKELVDKVPVFWLLAVRFGLSAVVMGLVLNRRLVAALRDRASRKLGFGLGVMNFSAYALQTVGLSLTTPGRNSFLTGCYCVMMPFAMWLFGGGRPAPRHVLAALTCVTGIGLVAADGGWMLNLGDWLTLGCALFYALQYVFLARYGSDKDAFSLTAMQFLVMCPLATLTSALFERGLVVPPLTVSDIGAMAFLVLICSCFNFAAINHGMTRVDPAEGSILSALEAPFGILASVLIYHESLTLRLIGGFSLIFVAIVISEAGEELIAHWVNPMRVWFTGGNMQR